MTITPAGDLPVGMTVDEDNDNSAATITDNDGAPHGDKVALNISDVNMDEISTMEKVPVPLSWAVNGEVVLNVT